MADEVWAPLLQEAESGVPGGKERLFTALYAELHRLAERQLRASSGVPISPTTLLHETYLGISRGQAVFTNRGHFMSYAARVMRSLIIDFARARRAQKRGAEFHITQFETGAAEQQSASVDDRMLEQLSLALDELAVHDPRLAEVVDLRYFCGLSVAEVAAMRSVSERTVQRDWDKARLFLFHELED
ncbi:MAG TPA: ECF-type sigma factor [Steroidobacteraceae bacterium]|jgi:RNA polymerase sigma factor (TIGR02999 family)|nr:ECF-type sigma factor [Steroidobacteraceae bacterium]